MKPGDWAKHPKIEQAMYLEKIEDGTAWLRSPGVDGWMFPVWFALPLNELSPYGDTTFVEALF